MVWTPERDRDFKRGVVDTGNGARVCVVRLNEKRCAVCQSGCAVCQSAVCGKVVLRE